MANVPALPRYDDIVDALLVAHSSFDAAQVHGLFCGLICGTVSNQPTVSWQKTILPAKKPAHSLEILEELYEISYHLLNEFSFEFLLALPEDSVDINTRAEALGLWCQGFLAGLQQCRILIADREPSEMKDALDDIVEIAQISFGDIAQSEADETAYYELVEHIRLSVQLIYHELKMGEPESQLH